MPTFLALAVPLFSYLDAHLSNNAIWHQDKASHYLQKNYQKNGSFVLVQIQQPMPNGFFGDGQE